LTWFYLALSLVGLIAAGVVFVKILLRDEETTLVEYVRTIFRSPADVITSSLSAGENLIIWKRPAISAYLWRERRLALQTFLAFAILVAVSVAGDFFSGWWLLAFAVFDGHVLYLGYKRLEDLYTLYVFTDRRVVRFSGVFNRDEASIDWVNVVDFSWQQSFLGRLLGYATLRVDSASEKASLKEMRDLPGRGNINNVVNERMNATGTP
jgi:hypothetical protein